jgi:hypothetical protein
MLRWRSKRTGPKSRFFTYFTILALVVALAGVADITGGNAGRGAIALTIAAVAGAVSEYLVWRYGD